MKIVVKDKRKFKARIYELITIILTVIVTMIAIRYAAALRGYDAIGGEFFIPYFGIIFIIIIEDICKEKGE